MRRTLLLLSLAAAVTGCGDDSETSGDSSPAGDLGTAQRSLSVVMSKLELIAVDEETGTVPGFDLDGRVSDHSDAEACRKPDADSPDGEPGIDNQFALLVPFLLSINQGTFASLLQASINDGGLLMLVRLEETETGHRLIILRGTDPPLLGTNGVILSGQTFDLHEEPLLGWTDEVRVEGDIMAGATVDAGPFDFLLPVVVFGVLYELNLTMGRVRFETTESGAFTNVVVGGAASLDDVGDIAAEAASRDGSAELDDIAPLAQLYADLEPGEDGQCTALSAALGVQTVPAHIFGDALDQVRSGLTAD